MKKQGSSVTKHLTAWMTGHGEKTTWSSRPRTAMQHTTAPGYRHNLESGSQETPRHTMCTHNLVYAQCCFPSRTLACSIDVLNKN